MNDCCSPAGYRWAFSERRARKEARRYQNRGLDRTSRRIVELLKVHGVDGLTLLEIGGGVGALQIELLKAGVTRVADMPKLTAAASAHTQRLLVLSFPKATWWTRMCLAIGNAVLRATRRGFRVFVHPPDAILTSARRSGLATTRNRTGLFWQIVALQRVG